MIVRPAFFDDEDPIVRIMNQGIRSISNAYLEELDYTTGKSWYNKLKANSNSLLVVENADSIVAWGSLSAYRSGRGALLSTEEITFYVDKDHQRLGIASKLIQHLEEDACDRNVDHLVAILLDDNVGSRHLLEKHGFFVWGVFEGIAHFPDKARGHMYMGKHLR